MLDIYSGVGVAFLHFFFAFFDPPKVAFFAFFAWHVTYLVLLFSTLRIFIGEGLSPTAHSGLPEKGGLPKQRMAQE